MIRFLLLHIALICLAVEARDYSFERINANDGLSQNNVLSMHQCKDGYLWIASYDGLNRYDGYDFKVYRNSIHDTSSLTSNLIGYITEDQRGNIWVTTFSDGICCFHKNTEKFTRYRNTEAKPDFLVSNTVSHIFFDSKDKLWLSTNKGIHFFEMSNGEIVNSLVITNTAKAYGEEDLVNSVYEAPDGNYYVLSNGGMGIVNKDAHGAIQNTYRYILPANNIWTMQQMVQVPDGYLMNHYEGLFFLQLDPSSDAVITQIIRLSDHQSHRFIVDRGGNVWSGGNGGLYLFTPTYDKNMPYELTQHFVEGESDEFLSDNVIRSFEIDNTGIIWIGTNGNGLLKCNLTKSKFRHYTKTHLTGSISAKKIWNIYEDAAHNLWFSTEGGGINLLPAYKNKDYKQGFTAFNVNPPNGYNLAYQMLDISKANSTEFLLGTSYPNMLVKISPSGNSWRIDTLETAIDRQIMTLCKDANGTVWIGSYNSGLYRWDSGSSEDQIKQYLPENSTLPSVIIRNIVEDSKGRLWIGTDKGLAVLAPEDKASEHPNFKVFLNNPNDSTSLSHNYVVPIKETRKQELWIGTFGGALSIYREGSTATNGSFSRIGIPEGLPSNTIKQIIEDTYGNLWITTNKGVSRIDSTRLKIRNFDLNDGLQNMEFTDLAGTKLSDGEIILGGINGFNAFYPNEIYEDTIAPILILTDIEVMGNIQQISTIPGDGALLHRVLNNTDKITLRHNQNHFTIYFSAIHYSVPKGNQFKYTLEGIDKQWISTTYKSRFARYTNIDPGTYTFKLLAANSHGVWTKEAKTLTLMVKPPFWKTWWFIVLLCGISALLVIALIHWRTRQVRKQNILLEKKVQLRTLEILEKNATLEQQAVELNEANVVLEERQQQIEEQAEELTVQKEELLHQRDELTKSNAVKDKLFAIVAHDLKNPFTSLSGLIDVLVIKYDKYNDEKRKNILKHASRAAGTIQELLLNLLSWARSQSGSITFKPIEANIVELVKNNVRLISNQAKEKNIDIQLYTSDDFIIFNYDPDLMNAIIRNLLNNALKFTFEQGHVVIRCNSNEEQVTLSVSDDGVGIDAKNIPMLFREDTQFTTYGTKNEKGTGLGLLACKEFVAMHGGSISVKSEMEKGTTFTIILPKS